MVLFVACTDVTDLIGSEFVPDTSDLDMNFTDTVTIETYSIIKDSVINSASTPYLLGSIIDPIFGKTTASINSKFLLSLGFDSVFREAEFFDSLVLSLSYFGLSYGDTLADQTIRIYELEENFNDSSNYSSSYNAQHSLVELAAHTFSPKPNTKVSIIEGDTISPQIRVTITKSKDHPFASKLLDIKIEDYLEYSDVLGYDIVLSEKFYEYFNGLHISTDPVNSGEGSLFGMNFYAANTRLELYKHDTVHGKTSDGLNDSIIDVNRFSSLIVSTSSGKVFNHYDHSDYVDADNLFIDQVINGDKELGKEQVYIQSLAGTHLRVKFPYIQNLKNMGSKIAINKAELVLSLAEDRELAAFEAPINLDARIMLAGADSAAILPDIAFGESYFGGTLDTTANEYRFRITNYLQDVLNGMTINEDGLFIFSDLENKTYSRVLLIGSDPMLPIPYSKRARLEITYTIID